MSTTPSTDDTERARRDLLPTMPTECQAALERGEQVWDTEQLTTEYEVTGFLAPFVVVRRRADGATGSLMFTHRPRWYFGWQPA